MDQGTLIEKKEDLLLSGIQTQRKGRTAWRSIGFGFALLIFLLFMSTALNVLLVFQQSRRLFTPETERTRFASLEWNSVQPYYEETPYSEKHNDSSASELWYDIDIDSGVIALSDQYVASQGLAPAERFPWDPTKGIYIVHGYHNLHCLKIIYISLNEYRSGQEQSRKWHHVAHCFDALRRQVLCDADDTPRAVKRELDGVSGVGQHRQCRNWTKLEDWARSHTACYKRPDRPVPGMKNIDKYKHCPEGSGYNVPKGHG